MVIAVGLIICIAGTLTGFSLAHGDPKELWVFPEYVTIFSLTIGSLVIMAPVAVLKEIAKKSMAVFKGAPFKKADFEDLLKVMYELFVLGRRNGMIALEEHVMNPMGSSLFKKYDSFYKNKDAVEFFCDGLRPIVDGRIKPDQLAPLLDKSLATWTKERHNAPLVLGKTSDALPGFGIVAAVLGIIVTMGSLGGDVSEVGTHVAHALTGTFLGIFLCYGIVGPIMTNIEFYNASQLIYLNCIKSAVVSFANGLPPLVAAEVGRRVLTEEMRPNAMDLESALKTMGSK